MHIEKYSFRDKPTNIDEEGNRKWIYAKQPHGRLYTLRTFVGWGLLIFLVMMPFIRVNGYPLILLDIPDRRFIIFGAIFWAQDTFILSLLMLSFVLFIVLFTVTFGRVWCGWACPQTIFLEMVFRRIEFWIEGDYKQRRRLDTTNWNFEKIWKKLAKHSLFILIALMMTNVFLMWFIGSEKWIRLIREPISEHKVGFTAMLAVSGIFYWIYSWFREQVCTMVCPYGRMQGVLLDSKSIVVSYDYKRGEPRGANEGGDCIDCRRCLAVCPTGIDIRNGTQFECIHCTSCIDECNDVMKRTGRVPGLIRYSSALGIEEKHESIWNIRNVSYTSVLIVLLGFFAYSFVSRPVIETSILRTPGLLFQENNDGTISNLYNIKIVNKSHETHNLEIKLLSHDGRIEMAGKNIILYDQELFQSTFILFIPAEQINSENMKVEFGIFEDNKLLETFNTTFIYR